MNGRIWADAEALIRSIDMGDWDARVAAISRDLPQWVISGRIDEATAERIDAALQARHARHATAAEKRGRLGGITGKLVGQSRPATPVMAQRRAVRGPSRYSATERRLRAYRRRVQAKYAKVPAELWGLYGVAESAAISIIVLDCRESGECTRTVARIAGSAAVSRRSVQYALRHAARCGLLQVEEVPGKPSRITMLDPRLIAWVEGLDGYRQAPSPEKEKIEDSGEDINSPPRGANACTASDEKLENALLRFDQVVLSKLSAEARKGFEDDS